jgi:hypothetical protein
MLGVLRAGASVFVILLSLPKYMTELQFKVASLIPTFLLRFKCALVPEGEVFPCPGGRAFASLSLRERERG